MNKKEYVTPLGYELLKNKLKKLTKEKDDIMSLLKDITRNGTAQDLSENNEYLQLSEEFRNTESQISVYKTKIENSLIVKIEDIIKNNTDKKVYFSSTVHLIDENENKIIYKIVGEDESDIKNNKLSYTSPLGRELIGCYVGDDVCIKKPNGESSSYEIIEIEYI